MINFAKFEIIGRIGEIDARPKVTLLSVCANYRRKGDDDEWQEDSHWNRVSVFSASASISPTEPKSGIWCALPGGSRTAPMNATA